MAEKEKKEGIKGADYCIAHAPNWKYSKNIKAKRI